MPEVFVERGKSYYFRVQVSLCIALKKFSKMFQAYFFVKLSVFLPATGHRMVRFVVVLGGGGGKAV